MQQRFDDFDEDNEQGSFARMVSMFDPRGRLRARSPVFAVAIVAVLAVLLVGVIWASYPRVRVTPGGDVVPIISADAGPVKTAPEEQGGMNIPYRESTVFNSMRGDAGGKVENLLPKPEQPVDRNQVFAGLKDQPQTSATAAPVDISEGAAQPQAQAQPQQPQVATAASAVQPAPQQQAIIEPVKPAAVEPASGEQVKADLSGTHFVQLASIKDKASAPAAWKKLQASFPSLNGQTYRVQPVAVAGNTLFRLQAGPLSDAKAHSLCAAIDAKKPGSCFVVRR